MAINTYLIGNDGNVTLSSADEEFKVRSFAATLTRPSSDLTAFGDTGKRRRLGLLDLTGSLNAVMGVNSSATGSTTSFFVDTAAALTLTLFDSTNDSKIVANCTFNSFAFNSDKNGDATLTANFENADGAAPVVTWQV